MIRIVDWTTRNTARLTHLRKVRLGRGLDPMAPAVLDGYSAASSPSKAFLEFAGRLRLRDAESFWHRVNEYCAAHAAQTGEIRVPRAEFGRAVLSRGLDPISRSLGERVYDALVASKLAEPITDGVGATVVTAQKARRDGTGRRAVTAQPGDGDGTSGDVVTAQESAQDTSQDGSGDGTSCAAVPSQAPAGADTAAPAVTAQPGPPARARGAQGARKAGARHAPSAREGLSLEGPFCDGTGDAPDQTRPELQERDQAAIERLRREIQAITFDRGDQRRPTALSLWNARVSATLPWWLDTAEGLLRQPRLRELAATASGNGVVMGRP